MSKLIRIRVAGLLSQRGKVLLVCHQRDGERYWLLPGGGVEYGETLAQALAREFLEETNLKVKVGKLLIVDETIAPDGTRHGLHFTFLVRRISGELKVRRDRRLKSASFVSWPMLRNLELRPAFGRSLINAHRVKFKAPIQFLGNLWV